MLDLLSYTVGTIVHDQEGVVTLYPLMSCDTISYFILFTNYFRGWFFVIIDFLTQLPLPLVFSEVPSPLRITPRTYC